MTAASVRAGNTKRMGLVVLIASFQARGASYTGNFAHVDPAAN
jgi:hypothetical protein